MTLPKQITYTLNEKGNDPSDPKVILEQIKTMPFLILTDTFVSKTQVWEKPIASFPDPINELFLDDGAGNNELIFIASYQTASRNSNYIYYDKVHKCYVNIPVIEDVDMDSFTRRDIPVSAITYPSAGNNAGNSNSLYTYNEYAEMPEPPGKLGVSKLVALSVQGILANGSISRAKYSDTPDLYEELNLIYLLEISPSDLGLNGVPIHVYTLYQDGHFTNRLRSAGIQQTTKLYIPLA